MAFEALSLDDWHQLDLDLFRVLLGEMDISEFSHNWKWTRVMAGGTYGNQAHFDSVNNDVMPDTATDEMADRWGNLRGVKRKGASGASKAFALRIQGTAGKPVPADRTLVHKPSGLQFRTVGASVVGATGTVDVGVAAIDVGSKTRLNAGEVLSFADTPADLVEDAELQLDLDEGGEDAERDDDYKPRYLARWSNPPLGRSASDFVQLATDQPGVAQAYCYPTRLGPASVDIAPLARGSNRFRRLTEAATAALFATMNARRPIGMKQFRVLQVEPQVVNVEVTILDDGSLSSVPDWDDRTAPTCASWNATTRTLQFAGGARPPSLRPNGRITISNGDTGRERVVERTSGDDSVVLLFDGSGDSPAPGSVIYAGGPLVEPSRRAIQDVFDALGTANPDATRYGTWEGNLRPTAISRAVTAVPGVLDIGQLISPTATVTAADPAANPLDNTIGLLIAQRILVRSAH